LGHVALRDPGVQPLGWFVGGEVVPVSAPKPLTGEQFAEMLDLLRGADTAELKLTVPESERYGAFQALEVDPLDARMRQVVFFDTSDLALNSAGVVVRVRRIQDAIADTEVKLRPVAPADLRAELRRIHHSVSRWTRCPAGSCARHRSRARAPMTQLRDPARARRLGRGRSAVRET
jgi:hypothetical protein